MNKEELLEELGAVKHCIEMTKTNIADDSTRREILQTLDKRISQLESDVDAKIAAEEAATDQFEVA